MPPENMLAATLESLNMDPWIIGCARGEIIPPPFSIDWPCNLSYGFPPCLIPIWSSSAGPYYIGALHHWFGQRRTTFVTYYLEDGLFSEIATTADQLRIWIAFLLYCNVPDEKEVAGFCEHVGLCDAKSLDAFFEPYNSIEDFAASPVFRDSPPSSMIPNANPLLVNDKIISNLDLRRYCEFEVARTLLPGDANSPEWFNCQNQAELFQKLVAVGDLPGAWFCLNSRGWLLGEAKVALEQIALVSGIRPLIRWADWIITHVPDETTY